MNPLRRPAAGPAQSLFVALLGAVLLAGCATNNAQVAGANPYPPVPALPGDNPSLPPVSEQPLIWQPGHWDWTGNGYAYVKGAWVKRAGHGVMWQDGYWAQGPTGWAWVPAHWM